MNRSGRRNESAAKPRKKPGSAPTVRAVKRAPSLAASPVRQEKTTAVVRPLVKREKLSELHADDPMRRIDVVRKGLPATWIAVIADEMAMSKERVLGALGVARATGMRQISEGAMLSREATERAVFVAGLVKTVEAMIPGAGSRGFNASHWVADWLGQPQPALGGKTPEMFLDTADGRAIVGRLLGQIESGAYA